MTFLLGRHAMFGHAPPTYCRSITATREPSLASVHASSLPALPLPSTTMSYSSMLAMRYSLFLSIVTVAAGESKPCHGSKTNDERGVARTLQVRRVRITDAFFLL